MGPLLRTLVLLEPCNCHGGGIQLLVLFECNSLRTKAGSRPSKCILGVHLHVSMVIQHTESDSISISVDAPAGVNATPFFNRYDDVQTWEIEIGS